MGDRTFTHKTAENAKPKAAPYKLSTGRGFYLLVMPTGGKLWRYDYRLGGKRKTAALGSFPEVSLKDAADRVGEYRKLLREGRDPVAEKKRTKAEERQKELERTHTFEVVPVNGSRNEPPTRRKGIKSNCSPAWKTAFFPTLENAPLPNWKRGERGKWRTGWHSYSIK